MTTLKTVSMYLRAAKTDAEAAGIETEGMAKSVAKLRDDILTIADVDIMIDATTFKSTYEILDEISKVWDDILDVDRSNLLNLMGGKRNANVLASIIENFDEARAAVEAAENSAGSATKENEKWLESIEGHLNQLKVTYEEFSQTIMGSSFIKFIIDFLTNTVKLIDNVTKAFGGLTPVVLSLLGNGLLNRNKWGFSTAIDGAHQRLTLFGKTIGYAGSQFEALRKTTNAAGKELGTFGALWRAFTDRMKSGFGGIMTQADVSRNVGLIKGYYSSLLNPQEGQTRTSIYKEWFSSFGKFKDATPEVKKFAKELTTAYAKGQNVNKMIDEFAASQEGLRKGSSVWHTIGSGLANIALNLGVTIALNLAIQAITSAIQKHQEAIEQARKAAEKFQETYGSVDTTIQKVIKLQAELDNANTTEARAKTIKEELVSIQNELNETYKDEAGYIDLTTNSIENYVDAIRKKNAAEYEQVDYYKQSGSIIDTVSKFNKPTIQLNERAFHNDFFDAYETEVTETLEEIYKSLGFAAQYVRVGDSNSIQGFTSNRDIFTTDQKLLEAQKQIEKYINDDTLTRSVREHYQKAFNYIGEVRSNFVDKVLENQATFEAWIINASDYSDEYDELIRAQANYQYKISKAKTEEEVQQIREEYEAALEAAFAGIDGNKDPAVLAWFRSKFKIPESEVKQTTDRIESYIETVYNDFKSSLDGIYEEFDTAFSKQSTIQSAFDKIQSGTDLTASEMRSLIKLCKEEFPEIGVLFTKTANGWTISSDDLIKANDALMKSTKDMVQQQIDDANEVIKAYENRFVTIPKGGHTIQVETDIGISEEEYKSAIEQVENLKRVLESLGLVLDSDADKMEQFTKTLKTLSTNISAGVSAQKEMNENGKISASALESLLSLGDDYIKCITIENGIIKFNADIFKDVTKAKLDDEIATLKLAQAEAIHARIEDAQYNKGKEGTKLQAIINETNLKLKAAQALRDGLDETWENELKDKSGSKDDKTKQDFDKYMQEYEKLHERGLMSDKDYYDKLEYANETFYKNCTDHLDDYISNETKIYNARKTQFKSNTDEMIDDLEKQFERGEISAEQLAKSISDIRDTRYGEGSTYAGTEFASDEYKSLTEKLTGYTDDEYSEALDNLKKKNDGALKSEEQFIEDWIKLNDDTWKGVNPKEWAENYSEIADYTQDFYKDLLDDGVLDVNQYVHKVNVFFNQLKGLGIELGENWLAEALNDAKDIDFERFKRNLSADGDTDIEDVINDANKLAKKNITLFADTPETIKQKGEEIFDSLVSSAQEALSKGLISPDRYLEIIDIFADTWQEKLGLTQGVIDEAKNALEVGDWMDAWDRNHGYDEDKDKNNFQLRQDRIDEYRNKIIETYGVDGVKNIKAYTEAMKEADEQQKQLNEDTYAKTKDDLSADGNKTLSNVLSDAETLWNDTLSLFVSDEDTIKENAKDIFDSVSETLKDTLEKGIISAEEYETQLRSWGDKLQLTEADITDALIDTYDKRAEALQKANDGSLESERKYISDMKALNFSTYGDDDSDYYDPNTYASNLRDITDHELDVLEEALKKGEISTREYAEAVAEILGDADVLGADYIAEKQEEIDKTRAEREKEYWEQQKELVEDYYDKQIEKLEKIQDEQEKITKAEELRLNLIKARKALEEAQNNRNQLVFHDGIFEYMTDQDAVMSAEEEVAEAIKSIKENELQKQIDILKSQKDEALSFYVDMISMIEAYINETVNIAESDSETLQKIKDSQYGREWKDVRYGDTTANEVTEEQKKSIEKSNDKSDAKANGNNKVTVVAESVEIESNKDFDTSDNSDDTTKTNNEKTQDIKSKLEEHLIVWQDILLGKSIIEIKDTVRALWDRVKSSDKIGLDNSYAQEAVASAINNVYNNSNISDDHSVNVGDIHMTIQGGTSQEMLDQFANKLSSAITTAVPRVLL